MPDASVQGKKSSPAQKGGEKQSWRLGRVDKKNPGRHLPPGGKKNLAGVKLTDNSIPGGRGGGGSSLGKKKQNKQKTLLGREKREKKPPSLGKRGTTGMHLFF